MGIIALVHTFNLCLVLARVFNACSPTHFPLARVFLTRAHFVYTNRFHKRY